MSKKVIIFTYYWPPAGGIAVQRFLKFSKYLPQFGWEPIIITVDNGSYPNYDESLLKEVSPTLRVYKTKTSEPFELYNLMRGKKGKSMPVVSVGDTGNKTWFQKISEYIRANFFIPDARVGWIKYAVKQAAEIIQGEIIDAIITTGPPHSAHLIGLELKKKYGIKWIADFRDPWTGIFYNKILPRNRRARLKDERLETEVLNAADAVTVIGPTLKKSFESRSKNIKIIYNGYDEDDFKPGPLNNKSENFTIRYIGNLLASENIPVLWNVLAKFKAINKNMVVEFIGRADASAKQSISAAGLDSTTRFLDFVGHSRATELMGSADLLLLIIPQVGGNELIITGKLFEYIGSRTEILGIGPVNGDAAELLKATGRLQMVDYNNESNMYAAIELAYNKWKSSQAVGRYSIESGVSFTRRSQTMSMVEVLNNLS